MQSTGSEGISTARVRPTWGDSASQFRIAIPTVHRVLVAHSVRRHDCPQGSKPRLARSLSAQATRPTCLSGRRNPRPLSRYSAGTAILNRCGLGAPLTSRPWKGRSALLQGSRQRTLACGGSGPWQDRDLRGFGPSSGRAASLCGTRTTFFRELPRPRRTLTTRSSRMLPASLACTRRPPPARLSGTLSALPSMAGKGPAGAVRPGRNGIDPPIERRVTTMGREFVSCSSPTGSASPLDRRNLRGRGRRRASPTAICRRTQRLRHPYHPTGSRHGTT